jgi:transcriptional regulator with XRE-family HTH domain
MFGEQLKKLRKERKLNQIDFAKSVQISQGQLSSYEANKYKPSFDVIKRMADFFGVSTDYLLGNTDDRTPLNKAPTLNDIKIADLTSINGVPISDSDKQLIESYIDVLLKGRNGD